eukprot:scaffold109_cov252-Pinguiococcus_pyrenoidosus.AAC.16
MGLVRSLLLGKVRSCAFDPSNMTSPRKGQSTFHRYAQQKRHGTFGCWADASTTCTAWERSFRKRSRRSSPGPSAPSAAGPSDSLVSSPIRDGRFPIPESPSMRISQDAAQGPSVSL